MSWLPHSALIVWRGAALCWTHGTDIVILLLPFLTGSLIASLSALLRLPLGVRLRRRLLSLIPVIGQLLEPFVFDFVLLKVFVLI